MKTPAALIFAAVAVCAPAACSSPSSVSAEVDASAAPDAAVEAADEPDPRLAARPYDVHVPPGYNATKPAALVLAFHGYGSGDDGALLEKYFKLRKVSDASNFLYVTPNGTKDDDEERFWNGTDACCDFYQKRPDDVGYVRAIVADVAKHYAMDPKRVYAVGLSGGGFFVHRLACDASDLFAAVISVSGATYGDASKCKPKEGISVLELHGDKDASVAYGGGSLSYGAQVRYASAKDTVQQWSHHNGCTGALVSAGPDLDLDASQPGVDTTMERYEGCAKGSVELWTVKGGVHAPPYTAAFGPALWRFLEAHPKR